MFPYYFYYLPYYVNSFPYQPELPYERNTAFAYDERQPVHGQVTWTYGGPVTKCEMPWSENNYMTVAVARNSPYRCGQFIRLRNIQAPYGREVVVKVVDEVKDYPPNRLNIHRNAFEALGVNPNVGVLNVEIIPASDSQMEGWGARLLHVVETAYPGYRIAEYHLLTKTKISNTAMKESYSFKLQSSQGNLDIQGDIIYNPKANRLSSFQIKEI
ncbi:YqzG/YhdC family protein [Oceanobacillus caeni]|uniref:YqzG/YhdC family protein n=1 Tax=Oceanobacillus caeni TaxID=405946 RepID=UPI001C21224C|nr:YqzG/YhdC family protein [Oceanobacillus caeni]MBU8790760.1 YqzG/YhdC family protein [Oceanobacillus caeni]